MCHWAMAEEGLLLRETSAIASPQRMLQLCPELVQALWLGHGAEAWTQS